MMLALRLSLRVTGVKPGPADAHDASLGVVFGAGMVEPGRADAHDAGLVVVSATTVKSGQADAHDASHGGGDC